MYKFLNFFIHFWSVFFLEKKKDEETASEYLGIVVMHVEVMETHMMDRCIRFDIDGVPVFCLLVSIWALSSKL